MRRNRLLVKSRIGSFSKQAPIETVIFADKQSDIGRAEMIVAFYVCSVNYFFAYNKMYFGVPRNSIAWRDEGGSLKTM